MNILAFLCLIHIAIKREAKWINSVLSWQRKKRFYLSKNNKKILTIKKYSDILWQEREKVEP